MNSVQYSLVRLTYAYGYTLDGYSLRASGT